MQGPRGVGALSRRRAIAGGVALGFAPLSGCCLIQNCLPVVGYLDTVAIDGGVGAANVAAFQQGMADEGLVEGDTYTIEARATDGRLDQLPILAQELADLNVAIIFAGSPAAARAAKDATAIIPIVFGQAGDPVENGEVVNLGRPEGNLTGIANFNDLDPRRLRLLDSLVTPGARIAYLSDSNLISYQRMLDETEKEAVRLKRPLTVLKAGNDTELAIAYNRLGSAGVGGLLVGSIRGLRGHPRKLVEIAAHRGLPAIYFNRTFVDAGGLMSYGAAYKQIYRLAGHYAARILKGASPADLPVLQPDAFELVVNQNTARAQRLNLPPELLAEANEVVG